MERHDGTRYLSFPSIFYDGKQIELIHPSNKPTRKWLETSIFDVYESTGKIEDKEIIFDEETSLVNITGVRPYLFQNKPLLNDKVSILLEDKLIFYAKVKRNIAGVPYLEMEHIQPSGRSELFVNPITSEMKQYIEETVFATEDIQRLILSKFK